MRVRVLEADDLAHHRLRQFVGVTFRLPALFGDAFQAFGDEALLPFVAGLGADLILAAQLAEISGVQRLEGKFDSLVHDSGLFPWHSSWLLRSHEVAKALPMY